MLNSIRELNAPVFILDFGSIDNTLKIAEEFGAKVLYNKFVNHPKQWDFALKNFDIKTPWTIGLDADQIVLPELFEKLKNFKDEDIPKNVNGIYFNRKNYFKGKWIKNGGYFPKYLPKMFRTGVGYSDANENMQILDFWMVLYMDLFLDYYYWFFNILFNLILRNFRFSLL